MILIYDAQCDFCKNCVAWISNRVSLTALGYQEIDLTAYLISEAEASQSVYLILPNRSLRGARAISFLLMKTRWKIIGFLIFLSGPLGQLSYRWISLHRNSALVRLLNFLVRKSA